MSSSFPITEAQLVGMFMECVAYGMWSIWLLSLLTLNGNPTGIFLVSFGLCMKALLCHREKVALKELRDINWGMFSVAILMLIFASLDGKACFHLDERQTYSYTVAFGLRHNLVAFVFFNGGNAAEAEFGDMRYWINIMKAVDFIGQTAVGDAILVSNLSHVILFIRLTFC
jgi:hypothetical protein